MRTEGPTGQQVGESMATLRFGKVKRDVELGGVRTTIAFEPIFWREFDRIAAERGTDYRDLVRELDKQKGEQRLSTTLRCFVLETVLAEANNDVGAGMGRTVVPRTSYLTGL